MKNNLSWLIAIIVAFIVYKILAKGILWSIVAFIVAYLIGYNISGLMPVSIEPSETDDDNLLNEIRE